MEKSSHNIRRSSSNHSLYCCYLFRSCSGYSRAGTYEAIFTQSVLDDGGSGHAGGGGGDRSSLFPKPLSADEVAARTKAVVANVEPSTATDIPDAVDVPSKG